MKKTVTERYVRLGKRVKNKLGIWTPQPCKTCDCVWKQVTETRKGRKIIKRRVTCYLCGKRQYGRRAEVQR